MSIIKQLASFPFMSCIDLKLLKGLVRQAQNIPGLEKTVQTFNHHYSLRTVLKMVDYDVLQLIAERINRRHKKNRLPSNNNFGNSQLKLFAWTLVLYCHINAVLPDSLTEFDYSKLQAVFRKVEMDRIVYEIHCFCYQKGTDHPWTEEEVQLFKIVVAEKNASEWKSISYEMFHRSNYRFFRLFEQYREKWISYLNPSLEKGRWTREEEIRMMQIVVQFGKKWALIARDFKHARSEHNIKNRYKKLDRELGGLWENRKCQEISLDQFILDQLLKIKEAEINQLKLTQRGLSDLKECWIKREVVEKWEEYDHKPHNKVKLDELYSTNLFVCPKEEDSFSNGYIFYNRGDPKRTLQAEQSDEKEVREGVKQEVGTDVTFVTY